MQCTIQISCKMWEHQGSCVVLLLLLLLPLKPKSLQRLFFVTLSTTSSSIWKLQFRCEDASNGKSEYGFKLIIELVSLMVPMEIRELWRLLKACSSKCQFFLVLRKIQELVGIPERRTILLSHVMQESCYFQEQFCCYISIFPTCTGY